MPNQRHSLMAGGIEFQVELDASADVMWVYDGLGNRVADAERDTAVEQVFVHYSDDDGQIEDASTEAPREIYDADWTVHWAIVARWLIDTHPIN